MATGWQKYPVDTVEVTELSNDDAFLSGLGYVGSLEGWKIFKKVGRFFKKVGSKLKKLKLKNVVAIGLPIAGIFLAPLALGAAGALAKKFGPKVGGLIKLGKTKAQVVRLANGAKAVGLVSPEEAARISKYTKDPRAAIDETTFAKLTGASILERIMQGAELVGNDVKIPVEPGVPVASGEEKPIAGEGPGFLASLPSWAPAAAVGAFFLFSRKR